jgi:hypothetical protein
LILAFLSRTWGEKLAFSLPLSIFHWYIHDYTSVKRIGEGLNVRKSKNKKRVVNKRKNGETKEDFN